MFFYLTDPSTVVKSFKSCWRVMLGETINITSIEFSGARVWTHDLLIGSSSPCLCFSSESCWICSKCFLYYMFVPAIKSCLRFSSEEIKRKRKQTPSVECIKDRLLTKCFRNARKYFSSTVCFIEILQCYLI